MIPLPENTQLLPDAEATAREAAERLLALCVNDGSERLSVCLSGGSTPKRLYQLLASREFLGRVPWRKIDWFFGDDRVVPWDDPLSNVRMVREAFGSGEPVSASRFHFILTEKGAEAGARAYEATLRGHYGADRLDPRRPLFDLVLLGLGTDGHTASLFPGKPETEERDAWAVAVPEAGMEPFVPRISLTFPALASSREVLFLVNGKGKRETLRRLAEGEDLPARHVTSQGRLTWLIDRDAADA